MSEELKTIDEHASTDQESANEQFPDSNSVAGSNDTKSHAEVSEPTAPSLSFYCKAGNYHFYNECQTTCEEAICGIMCVDLEFFEQRMVGAKLASLSKDAYARGAPPGTVNLTAGLKVSVKSSIYSNYCDQFFIIYGYVPALNHAGRCKALVNLYGSDEFYAVPIIDLVFLPNEVEYCEDRFDAFQAWLGKVGRRTFARFLLPKKPFVPPRDSQKRASAKAASKAIYELSPPKKMKPEAEKKDSKLTKSPSDDIFLHANMLKKNQQLKFEQRLSALEKELNTSKTESSKTHLALKKALTRIESLEKTVKSLLENPVRSVPALGSKTKVGKRTKTEDVGTPPNRVAIQKTPATPPELEIVARKAAEKALQMQMVDFQSRSYEPIANPPMHFGNPFPATHSFSHRPYLEGYPFSFSQMYNRNKMGGNIM